MSENSEQDKKNAVRNKTRRKHLVSFVVLLLLISIISFVYWLFFVKDFTETDDAYVAGNIIQVSSQVSGSVSQLNTESTSLVKKGDVLVQLDDTDAKLALSQAKHTLADVVRKTSQLAFTEKQLTSLLSAKKIALKQAEEDLARRQSLNKTGAVSKEDFQHAVDAVTMAKSDLEATQEQLNATKALLLDTPIEQQPNVIQAADNVRQAWLNLQRTKVVSPVTGYVAKRSAQVGESIKAGSPLLAVVPLDQIWIDANFKETQLKNIRLGQPVTVVFDLYGDNVEFDGKVVGIDAGTGSAFSLLPTQNATGNWIKVVQRLPVRIELDPEQVQKYPLRIGLSATVEVNTSDSSGAVLPTDSKAETRYATDTLNYDLAPINQEIIEIIQQNSH
ncbi:EmrA/EmrK family multidrug efflux transporter periplasmic adaptor subunit [Gallibacterium salpingitidis]|uniref:EmrA/EmrK family multidrug efflux transporter periplasmic adaptor subunit n=1 Tax=Gallibacterium salpingitidis TaxID=505341 RepID=UPI00266F0876|nr:EmrA/EmrK family multidrug efflux transporter periplasmic adaptor subunit [Gallibacterium salpingitidis]WKT00830.1 EmrA/EmrK family multidrug efflux transporter periplasmic adaptor subunit [Gallibacterium salpingitidis]